MAQAYRAPEMKTAPATNTPVNLLERSNGFLYVKFYFTDQNMIPRDFPAEVKREAAFPTEGGQRLDDGILAFERDNVSAELLRTGVANANGHEWKLINAGWWEQPITNPKLRAKLGVDTQFVVKLLYCQHPTDDSGKNPIMVLGRQTLDDIRVMAKSHSHRVRVWVNDGHALTINFTSPKAVEAVPAKWRIVVSKGCLNVVPV